MDSLLDYEFALFNSWHEMNFVLPPQVSVIKNVQWKEFGILCAVWVIILGLEIGKVPSSRFFFSYLFLVSS